MNDAARLLRYVIPGTLGASLAIVWLVLVGAASASALKGIDAAIAVPMAAGVILVVGFVASVVANEIRQRFEWCLLPFTDERLLADAGIVDPGGPLAREARADVLIHLLATNEARKAALGRLRELINLINGLGNAFGAVALAAIFTALHILLAYRSIVGQIFTPGVPDSVDIYGLVLLVLLALFRSGQRRVTLIARAFLVDYINSTR